MAEVEPVLQKAPQDERTLVTKLQTKIEKTQRELEKAQFDAQQKEAFGAYDDVVPAEGEVSYQEYLAQRPQAPEVLRNGDVYQHTETGKFASPKEYEAQKVSLREYEDTVGGFNDVSEYEQPNYEGMGVVQLAKEAAKARGIGDKAEEADIRAALEHHLATEASNNENETPEEVQLRHESEIVQYEYIVDRLVQKEKNSTLQASIEESPPPSEVAASPVEAEAPSPVVGVAAEEAAYESMSFAELVKQIREARARGDVTAEENIRAAAERHFSETILKDRSRTVEQQQTQLKSDLRYFDSVAAANSEAKEQDPARLEQLKGWFAKHKKSIQSIGGSLHWRDKWDSFRSGVKEGVLGYGVTETMTPQEKDESAKKSRVVFMVGAGVVLASTLATIGFPANTVDSSNEASATPTDSATTAETDTNQGNETESPNTGVDPGEVTDGDLGMGDEEDSVEVPAPEIDLPDEAYNISKGQGGEELFRDLGIDPAQWYTYENTLLEQFPDDFYRMNDGHVGLMRPGLLSQAAQDFINTLR